MGVPYPLRAQASQTIRARSGSGFFTQASASYGGGFGWSSFTSTSPAANAGNAPGSESSRGQFPEGSRLKTMQGLRLAARRYASVELALGGFPRTCGRGKQ